MAYVNQNGQVRIGVRGWVPVFGPEDPGTPNTIDQDSINFILASGISDSVQTSAIETLVSDLKAYGLWTKMKAIYPFVGGSAASHKFNLKDPRDLDAAYRLVFNGGWVHTSTGAKPNGTNGYSDTFVSNNLMNQNNISISTYLGADNLGNPSTTCAIGSWNGNHGSSIYPGGNTGNTLFIINGSSNNIRVNTDNKSRGLYLASKTTSASFVHVRGNKTNVTFTTSSNITSSFKLSKIGDYNGDYSGQQHRFTSIGDGLTDTEAANFYTSVQKFQTTLGRHLGTPYVSDPDAIAFLMAAGITDGTQAAAINTLVIRMKADGVWTKMRAIYPFVGGSAASHKFNLKDPRDLDAAYRLVFSGGWVHSSTGAQPNGSNAFADTKLNPSNVLTLNNSHLAYYSRTNTSSTIGIQGKTEIGTQILGSTSFFMGLYSYSNKSLVVMYDSTNNWSQNNETTSAVFGIGSRTSSNSLKYYRNGVAQLVTVNVSSGNYPNNNVYLAVNGNSSNKYEWSDRESAFASIGDGLTDAEAANLYTSVQEFQTTLGRQVNVPIVSDGDAQAFLNAANITSFQQASAINKLVVDLKAAGVWTKMKAIYPFVGGSAVSHKFNLKDPRDLDAAYRLVFNGGWTHTSTGAQPNGTTGYADTKLNENSVMTLGSEHMSYYSRTNILGLYVDMGVWNASSSYGTQILTRHTYLSSDSFLGYVTDANSSYITNTDSRGFFMTNRPSISQLKLQKNSSISTFSSNVVNKVNDNFWIGARNINSNSYLYSPRETAFASIGDGLTDGEATALYTAVQTYQTSLGRLVNTPVYNNGLVLNLDAGNANSYPGTGTTWFDLATSTNGTLVNSPTFNSNQFTFNGSNQFVNFGNTNNIGTDSVTLVAWIKTIANQDYAGIIGKAFYGDKLGRFSLHTRTGGKLGIITQNLQGGALQITEVTSTQNINTGNWVFVVGVIDRSYGNKLYINGFLDGVSTRDTSGVNWSTTDNFTIGFYNGNGNGYFNGSISNAFMYRRVLTDNEIMNLYNSTRGRFGL